MPCLTFFQLLGLEGLIVSFLMLSTPFFVPEVRRLLRLDPANQQQPLALKVLMAICILLMFISTLLVSWFLFCQLTARPVRPSPNPIPTPSPESIGPITVNPPVRVSGADFTLYVFSPEYHWRYGAVEAQFNKRIVTDEQMIAYISKLSKTMSTADAIICVGTASRDVQKDESLEENRAFTRAEQLIIWTRPAISQTGKDLDVYRLNLGHYRELPDKDEQRLIILMKVKKADPNISLDDLLATENSEVLKRKLKEKNFPFSFDSYSLFDLQKKP